MQTTKSQHINKKKKKNKNDIKIRNNTDDSPLDGED